MVGAGGADDEIGGSGTLGETVPTGFLAIYAQG